MTAPQIHERSRLVTVSKTVTCIACGVTINRGRQAYYASCREAGYRCRDCGAHPLGAGAPEFIPMRAKYCGPCKSCGRAIIPGEGIWWRTKKPHEVLCEGCGMEHLTIAGGRPQPPEPETPVTGEAARRRAALCPDGVHRYGYDSIDEAVRTALLDFAQTEANRGQLHGGDRWGSDYYHGYTKDRLLAELSHPCRRLTDAVQAMKDKITDTVAMPNTPRRRVRRGQEFGDEIDADRWLARDPFLWDRNVREQVPSRNVTIGCNISVIANRKAGELLWRGAAALALADYLTERGMNVQVVAYKAVDNPTRGVTKGVLRYTVKKSTQPMDVNALALALCEIAFARAVATVGGCRHWPGRLDTGLGYSCNLPLGDAASVDYLIEQTVQTQEAAEAWLRQCIGQHDKEITHV